MSKYKEHVDFWLPQVNVERFCTLSFRTKKYFGKGTEWAQLRAEEALFYYDLRGTQPELFKDVPF